MIFLIVSLLVSFKFKLTRKLTPKNGGNFGNYLRPVSYDML